MFTTMGRAVWMSIVAIVLGLVIVPIVFATAAPKDKKPAAAEKERRQILDVEFDSFSDKDGTFSYTIGSKLHTSAAGGWPSAFLEELVPLNELPANSELFVYGCVSRPKNTPSIDRVEVLFCAEHLRARTTCGSLTGTPPGDEDPDKRWYQGKTGKNKDQPKLDSHPMQIEAATAVVRTKSFPDDQFRQLKKGTKLRLLQVEVEDDDGKPVWMSQCAIVVNPKIPKAAAELIRAFEQALYVGQKFPGKK